MACPNAGWSYSQLNSVRTLSSYMNTTGTTQTCTKLYAMLGTGNGTFSAGQTAVGTGQPFETYMTLNGVETNRVTLTNVVGTQWGATGYFPIYSQCQQYEFTLSEPVTITPYQSVSIGIWSPGYGYVLCFYKASSQAIGLLLDDVTETYKITYDLDGGQGDFPEQEKKAGELIYLHEGEPTKADNKFDYWSDKNSSQTASGDDIYYPGAAYMADKNLELIASWSYNGSGPSPGSGTYVVYYNSFGGSYVSPSVGTITQDPIYEWVPDEETGASSGSGHWEIVGYRDVYNPITISGPPTKYATVVFNAMGGWGIPSSKSVSFSFQGWDDPLTGGTYYPGNSYNEGTTTMRARWNSVTVSGFPTPTRGPEYLFDGWYSNASYSGSPITSVSFNGDTQQNCSTTLYAKWKYHVTYDTSMLVNSDGEDESGLTNPDNGLLEIQDQWKTHNEALALTTIKPLLVGYEFIGWSTSYQTPPSDSAEFPYPNPVLPANINYPVVLYPVFRYGIYTITFDPNGGSWNGDTTPRSQQVRSGLDAIPEPDPTYVGKVFRGWYGQYTNVTASAIIYAIWDSSPVWIYSPSGKWVPYIHYSDYIGG